MSALAIITARGGSKRIPGKNVKNFHGKPIMAYSINAALKSSCFDEVMVSTDSQKIAKIATSEGAVVPFYRSEKTSDDYAITADVISEVIAEYENRDRFFDYICCIYPTAPFVTSRKLEEAMNILIEKGADTVFPIVAYSFPPQRGLIINNGYIQMQYPEYMNMRSQDLKPIYHDCGQFYCLRTAKFKEDKRLITANSLPIIIDEQEVQDIDNYSDWEIAEIKYELMKRRNKGD